MTVASPRIAVVGTGTIGAMIAWRLAEAGHRVTGYDRYWPGHEEGAAAGGTRMFRRVYAEGSEYGPLVDASWRLWRELEHQAAREILVRTGGLSIGPAHHPVLAGGIADARERGLPYEIIDSDDALRARYRQHGLRDGEVALYDPDAGVLRSNTAVVAAATAAARHGAVLRTDTRVVGIEETPAGAAVVTDEGREEYDHVFVATGPWAQELLPELPLQTRTIFHTWHHVHDRQLLRPDRFPLVLRRSGPDLSYGLMPALDGTRIKLAPHFEYDREVATVESMDRHVPVEFQRRATALVENLLPGVDPAPVEARIFPESFTPDGHAAVGARDADARIIVFAGFSGHGFKLSPGFGQAAVDIVRTGASPLLPTEVSLHRDFRAQVSIRDLVLDSIPSGAPAEPSPSLSS